jgi:hypothetical protein
MVENCLMLAKRCACCCAFLHVLFFALYETVGQSVSEFVLTLLCARALSLLSSFSHGYTTTNSIDFEVPMYVCSGLNIRFLNVTERGRNYVPFRWVRYITHSDSYVFRAR